MDHYINITVMPDPEFSATTLMNALYSKCHRVIAQKGDGQVGVSFPEIGKALGNSLRLHSTETQLTEFMSENWLKGLNDYVQVSGVSPVPDEAQHRCIYRARVKSAHNVRRRSVSKGWLSEAEALAKYPDSGDKQLDLPYAQLTSLSNKNSFQVFIGMGDCGEENVRGTFSNYGLSKTATVPWF